MPRTRLSTSSDAELLALAATDARAFGVFYDRFEADLLAFLYRATGRADIAADLTAEVFAAALHSLRGFDPARGSARAWLFGIARHELADTWRRGRVEDRARRSLEIEALVLADAALERIEAELGPDAGDALPLLAELPDEQRQAIQGRVLEDRDYTELAETLQCSAGVVRQRVSRGLRTLRARMEHMR
ncbi:MAG TPA: RNA polymerase sigma factor [Solirubrobacteraceae bacterium]|jgi:RNA polymerase sigma-70 factor (ECF subfamily)|nr:RNA polymerase sigma factor [Solirubrobacteraceae bacterium]